MKPIIRVENLGKRYVIGGNNTPYSTFRESIVNTLKAPFRSRQTDENSTFWALKDINFQINPGEVVGIIGRNGAGKSTLLKVLSRITEPSKGRIELFGRVGSLLEVGTGFHPELTGRENIFLNGAILGMRRDEIIKKFDEIVAFAEVEKFLDTPVKHYSSGMYVRLAFAVAAHLDSDILLVDEVLAVGDANFQKKCLGKMQEVGSQGRTVFFVSHSMPMILRLCQRVIMLQNGQVLEDGLPTKVANTYLHSDAGSPAQRTWERNKNSDNKIQLHSVRILDKENEVSESVEIQDEFTLEISYWDSDETDRPTLSVHFVNEEGTTLFCTNDFTNRDWWNTQRRQGLVKANCHIPGNFLAEGRIYISIYLCNYNPNSLYLEERDVVSFQVVDKTEGEGARGEFSGHFPGVMRPLLKWDVDYVDE